MDIHTLLLCDTQLHKYFTTWQRLPYSSIHTERTEKKDKNASLSGYVKLVLVESSRPLNKHFLLQTLPASVLFFFVIFVVVFVVTFYTQSIFCSMCLLVGWNPLIHVYSRRLYTFHSISCALPLRSDIALCDIFCLSAHLSTTVATSDTRMRYTRDGKVYNGWDE